MIYIILMDVKNLKRLLTQIKKRNKKQTIVPRNDKSHVYRYIQGTNFSPENDL